MPRRHLVAILLLAMIALVTAACGSSGDGAGTGRARVVVTTSILGDVVHQLVGHEADVTVIMPPGAGPHDFQASAKQAVAMRGADVLVVNGLGFEAGLLKAVDAARSDGVDVYDASSAIDPLVFGQEPGVRAATVGGDGAHEAGVEDPHWFTDPGRMVLAAKGIVAHLRSAIPGLDTPAFRARADRYIRRLTAAEARVRTILAPVPTARRVLVTNHDVFAYFAQRYDFTVVGAVIPSLSTQSEPSARALDRLAATIRAEHVPAVFADTSSPTALADKLAATGGLHVQVVELYSEALGPQGSAGATYIDMITTNAARMAAALR